MIDTPLTPFQRKFYVNSVRLTINSQPFYFDGFDLKHYQDKVYGDACYFTFQRNVSSIAAYRARLNRLVA